MYICIQIRAILEQVDMSDKHNTQIVYIYIYIYTHTHTHIHLYTDQGYSGASGHARQAQHTHCMYVCMYVCMYINI